MYLFRCLLYPSRFTFVCPSRFIFLQPGTLYLVIYDGVFSSCLGVLSLILILILFVTIEVFGVTILDLLMLKVQFTNTENSKSNMSKTNFQN